MITVKDKYQIVDLPTSQEDFYL